jgi:cell division protein FtsI/penicillin-binding protein 2
MVYKVRTSFSENRFRFIRYGIEAMAFLLILKLFSLQVWHHSDYEELALQNHNFNKKIFAHRGTIFFRDARTGEKSVAAIDKDYYTLSANPSQITFDRVNDLGEQLVKILNITDSGERTALFEKLSQHGSVYTVLAKKVPEETKIRLEELIASTKDQFKERFKKNTKEGVGIYLRSEPYRFYPEKELAAAVLGFGKKEDGKPIVGQYGIEGYWDQILTGTTGLIKGEKSNGGSWITLAGRTVVPAQNGADIILTIDRALQYRACGELKKMFDKIQSKDASLIVMNPKTGAILVMCSYPDFDPNEFQKVSSTEQFNNISIFTPYDPGS